MSHARTLKGLNAATTNQKTNTASVMTQIAIAMGFLVDKAVAGFLFIHPVIYYAPSRRSQSNDTRTIDSASFVGEDGLTYGIERTPHDGGQIDSLLKLVVEKCGAIVDIMSGMISFSGAEHEVATLRTPPSTFLSGGEALDAEAFRLLRGNATSTNSTTEACYTSAIDEYLKQQTDGVSGGGVAIIVSAVALSCVLMGVCAYAASRQNAAAQPAQRDNNIEMARRRHVSSSASSDAAASSRRHRRRSSRAVERQVEVASAGTVVPRR